MEFSPIRSWDALEHVALPIISAFTNYKQLFGNCFCRITQRINVRPGISTALDIFKILAKYVVSQDEV